MKHSSVLRRKIDKENRDSKPTWLLLRERAAIERAIELLERDESR